MRLQPRRQFAFCERTKPREHTCGSLVDMQLHINKALKYDVLAIMYYTKVFNVLMLFVKC